MEKLKAAESCLDRGVHMGMLYLDVKMLYLRSGGVHVDVLYLDV